MGRHTHDWAPNISYEIYLWFRSRISSWLGTRKCLKFKNFPLNLSRVFLQNMLILKILYKICSQLVDINFLPNISLIWRQTFLYPAPHCGQGSMSLCICLQHREGSELDPWVLLMICIEFMYAHPSVHVCPCIFVSKVENKVWSKDEQPY